VRVPGPGRLRALLSFLLVGGALFALDARLGAGRDPAPRRIEVTAGEIARLRADWARRHGATPSRAELAAAIRDAVDEEILFREALARGLDRGDAIVRQRIERDRAFVEDDAAALSAPGEDLLRGDVVVRRRLVARMKRELARSARAPTDAEIRAFHRDHRDRFLSPGWVHLTHVYLPRERSGEADAIEAVLPDSPVARAPSLGAPFLLGHELRASPERLSTLFGPGFGEAVAALAPGRWSQAIPSSYGLHWVYVHAREPAGPRPLHEVRERIRATLVAQREADAVDEALSALRLRYRVE
jgi:hypothetical protein